MGIDLERKFCRIDRRHQNRGKKKCQHTSSQSRLSKKHSRKRSLKKRRLQDVKFNQFFSSDWDTVVTRLRADDKGPRFFAKAVSMFTDHNFKCETPLPWDIGCPVKNPLEEHLAWAAKYPMDDYTPPLVRNMYDITQFYSIPDFGIQGYPEEKTCFDHNVLMTISEYVPEFGFQCFQRSKETMYDGSISQDCECPSIFHFVGNTKRDRTFVYKFARSGCVIYSDALSGLEKRHFRLESKTTIHITKANMLFRLDIGDDDSKKLLQCDARDWYSVTAFVTEANLVVLIFSSGKQELVSFRTNEYWCVDDDSSSLNYCENWGIGSEQEVYGYDLAVFLKLFHQAGNLYNMRFQKHCLLTRSLYNI